MKKIIFFFFLFPIVALAQDKNTIDTLRINCDSIYAKKGLSLLLLRYEHEENDGYFNEKNSVFILRKKINNVIKEIYRDSIFSKVQEISFKDFNNDKIKDILIQNTSSARSNWTYTLYLVNPKDYTLTKVKGFDKITEPTYNAKYDIIESFAASGRDYISFYKIMKNHIYDYEIVVYDDHEENDNYDKAYDKAIQKILKKNKALFKKK